MKPTAAVLFSFLWLISCGGAPPVAQTTTPESAENAKAPSPPRDPVAVFCDREFSLDTTTVVCSLEGVADVNALAGLTRLERLVLNHTRVTDFSPLSQLPMLRELVVSGSPISDVGTLKNLTGLRSLSLVHTDVADISFVAQLTALEELLMHNTPVADLTPLSGLSNLRILSIGPDVKNIAALAGLKKLEELVIVEAKISKDQLRRLKKAVPAVRIIN